MASINIIRPPKIKVDGKGKSFWSPVSTYKAHLDSIKAAMNIR